MLSIKNKFLFIHVPKTGGNSIQLILEKYSNDRIVDINESKDTFEVTNDLLLTTKHSPLSFYKNALNTKTYKDLYKFCVIRNPWEMMISYYFSPHWQNWSLYPFGSVWDEKAFIDLLNREEVQPLRYYISTSQHKKLGSEMDYIIRFENFESGVKNVLWLLNINETYLPYVNKSHHRNYKDYYSAELKELVAEKFNEEITLFNYKFD